MKVLLLLLIVGVSEVYSGHSLQYYYTGVSVPGHGLPLFSSVSYVDGIEITHYRSDVGREVLVAPWMKKVEDPDYWERNTQIYKGAEASLKQSVKNLMNGYNQTGAHEAINKWRTVRDNHTRVLKKEAEAARSGAGAKKRRSYLYADQLSFLRKSQEPRKTVSSIDRPSTSSSQGQDLQPAGSGSCQVEVEQGGAESQVEDVESQQVPGTAPTDSTSTAPRRKKPPSADVEQAMVAFMDAHHTHPRCMVADSEDMSFFNSCLSLLNIMTPAQKLDYRRRSLDLIHEILSHPQQAPVYHGVVPQYPHGYSHHCQALPARPPMSPVAGPPPEPEYHRSHMHGPHAPDAPRYHTM
uniref:MHC class I-like antigen recognition-like domain-containing protein n=1 Tax=Leptobrachium leishanense TaxID=445787 RepID=A0A8C5QZX3_9ANUR